MRSSAATRYQLDFDFHAGAVTLPPAASTLQGTCESAMNYASAAGRSAANEAGDIAAQLGLDEETQFACRHLFENHDGSGAPAGLSGEAVPIDVYLASLAGDLDIFTRLYGLEQACRLIDSRAGALYPKALASVAVAQAREWLAMLDEDPMLSGACSIEAMFAGRSTSLEILAHVIDLKLPWMTGHSLQAAQLARGAARQLGLDVAAQRRVYRAALIHGAGRAAVPNMIWDTPGRLSPSAWERVRLVPYWTGRAARQIGSLADEALLASYVYERSNGSGYFRELKAEAIPREGRILAASVALVALRASRPWREAYAHDAAGELLLAEAAAGRHDVDAVHALLERKRSLPDRPGATSSAGLLSEREREILRWISLGASNKVAAQKLSISPSTVRTHIESVFRKLECTTRAAATLKAAQLGLL